MVTGAGPIGLLTAQVARAFGALDVTVSDISEFRLSVARGLGFSVQRVGETQSREFDVLLECSGTQSALTAGVARSTEPGGSS